MGADAPHCQKISDGKRAAESQELRRKRRTTISLPLLRLLLEGKAEVTCYPVAARSPLQDRDVSCCRELIRKKNAVFILSCTFESRRQNRSQKLKLPSSNKK